MADVALLAVAVGFFGLCVAYVRGLDRMIRAAEDTSRIIETDPDAAPADVPGSTPSSTSPAGCLDDG